MSIFGRKLNVSNKILLGYVTKLQDMFGLIQKTK